MPNLRAGLLATLVLIGGCQGRDRQYPQEVADRFLASCIAKLPAGEERQRDAFAASCRCMLDRLQEKYSLEEFNALETRMRSGSGDVQEELAPIVAACREKTAASAGAPP